MCLFTKQSQVGIFDRNLYPAYLVDATTCTCFREYNCNPTCVTCEAGPGNQYTNCTPSLPSECMIASTTGQIVTGQISTSSQTTSSSSTLSMSSTSASSSSASSPQTTTSSSSTSSIDSTSGTSNSPAANSSHVFKIGWSMLMMLYVLILQ